MGDEAESGAGLSRGGGAIRALLLHLPFFSLLTPWLCSTYLCAVGSFVGLPSSAQSSAPGPFSLWLPVGSSSEGLSASAFMSSSESTTSVGQAIGRPAGRDQLHGQLED